MKSSRVLHSFLFGGCGVCPLFTFDFIEYITAFTAPINWMRFRSYFSFSLGFFSILGCTALCREWAKFEFHSFHLMNFVCQNGRFLFTRAFFFYITCHSLGEMSFSRAAALPLYSNFKISSKHWPVRILCLYRLGAGYTRHFTPHTHTQ